jgi:hypothetical protein
VTGPGLAIAGSLRQAFEALRELDKTQPAEVDQLIAAMVYHLRSWRPVAVAPLGVLPEPGEPVRDPRGPR